MRITVQLSKFFTLTAAAFGLALALGAPAAALDIPDAMAKLSAERDRLLAVQEAPGTLRTDVKLRKGMSGPEVAALRARLAELHPELLAERSGAVFDAGLEKAVTAAQKLYGLDADGVAGQATLETLNAPAARQAQRLALNIERLSALAGQIGPAPERLALVNIPAYQLTAYQGAAKVLESKVIVGKTDTPTPTMQSRFVSLKFNPDWRPAETNFKKYVNALARGNHKEITSHGLLILDQSGNEVPLETADAATFRAQGWRFWQPPGRGNALGVLKFEIDDHGQDIYLHDTNERHKFKNERRAYSGGCVRVERYEELAAWLMGKDVDWVRAGVGKGRTFWEKVPAQIPLTIAYITALPDETGTIRWYPDVYGHDAAALRNRAVTAAL